MVDFEKIIEHAIDREIRVVQLVMMILDSNNVTFDEWGRIMPILTTLVEEQRDFPYIKYSGEPV